MRDRPQITGVAVRLPSGDVLSLPAPARHCHLFREYNEKTGTLWRGWPTDQIRSGDQGFVDSTGAFRTRRAAARLARKCGQTNKLLRELTSEDVW